MTDNHPVNTPKTKEAIQARLSRPMPLRARRELDACVCIDQLAETLTRTRTAVEAMSEKAPALVTHVGWAPSLAELTVMFDQVDAHGRATIKAVRVMLGLE